MKDAEINVMENAVSINVFHASIPGLGFNGYGFTETVPEMYNAKKVLHIDEYNFVMQLDRVV